MKRSWIAFLAAAVLLGACNLGTDRDEGEITPPELVEPQDTGTDAVEPTSEGPPPTSTPEGGSGSLQSEQITSITVQSENFVTTEPITVVVERGSAVTSIACSLTLQATGEQIALTGNTTQQLNDTTFRETYTYTPTNAGTYNVTCTGTANTAGGTQNVRLTSEAFLIEAKG